MRFLGIIGIFAALALPSPALERVTVAQVEQILAAHTAEKHESRRETKSADEVADIGDSDLLHDLDHDDTLLSRLASLELTDRMSTLTLYRLVGKFKLGPQAQLALQEIADRSALLSLPADELVGLPAPDKEAQAAMFNAARDYVFRDLSHLPDFVATRTTTTFNDTPAPLKYFQSLADVGGFRKVGAVRRQISFRDGKEVLENEQDASRFAEDSFESRGEFGAQAAVVLMDLEQGTTTFDHWEKTMGGVAAVYRYSVPRSTSHYEVTDKCQDRASFHDIPGYSGSIALDPRTGAILRITLQAEWKSGDPISHVASIIEYGPVVIGNRRSLCPLRSLAFITQETNGCSHGSHRLQKPISAVNQTIFSNYHRFGSSATMIFDDADNDAGTGKKTGHVGEKKPAMNPAVTMQGKRP